MALLRLFRSAALVAVLTTVVVCPAPAQETLEGDVKAAYLYNFTKFIEWPALPASGEPFRICIVADAPFSRAVDRIIEGETVEGRRLVRIEPQTAQDARVCNILYVGRSDAERGLRLAESVRQAPVLTVGDLPRFVEQGGGIGFILDQNRVRFDINTAALQRAGLRASSKLLRVARTVSDRGTLR